jgi:hypothetical protein
MNRVAWGLFSVTLLSILAWGANRAHVEAVLGFLEPSSLAIAAVFVAAIIFVALFTGPIEGVRRFVWITRFSYVFTIAALLVSVLPFSLLKPEDARLNGKGALGIAVGCAEGNGEDQELPREVLCDKEHRNRFWLVNIGGAAELVEQSANEGGEAASASPILKITGGLVIPLYVLVLALMGAAVSMTRRVPEYQKRVAEANGVHSRNKQVSGYPKSEPISFARARELMVFQIMQVISAPMIALTAYYLILPDTRSTSVIIAFVSGFTSETILCLLRIAADGLTAKLDTDKRATAA